MDVPWLLIGITIVIVIATIIALVVWLPLFLGKRKTLPPEKQKPLKPLGDRKEAIETCNVSEIMGDQSEGAKNIKEVDISTLMMEELDE